MKIEVEMDFNSEKKNSVRYDAVTKNVALSTIYIMKHALTQPYPDTIRVTIEQPA